MKSGSSSTTPAKASAAAESPRTYTVVSGDSLSKIAKREYGDAAKWPLIHQANRDRIQNPDLIHPGQVLTLPRRLSGPMTRYHIRTLGYTSCLVLAFGSVRQEGQRLSRAFGHRKRDIS